MANAHFLTGAVSGAGTLSGGSWEADYPLSNLLKTQPGRVARSTNAAEASTRFVLDLGSAKPVQMFGFVNHNFSQGAEVRGRVSNNSDGSSPSLDVTFEAEKGQLEWGDLPWGAFPWDGIPEHFPGGFCTFYLHASAVSGRYVLIDVSDEDNAEGFVQLGCFLAGVPFVPAVNLSLGVAVGFVDESRIERAVGAGVYAQEKPKRRRVSGSAGYLSEAQALGDLYSMKKHVGRSKGVLFVLDPDEDGAMLRRRMVYGSLTEPGALTEGAAHDAPWSWSFAIEELI